MTSRFLLLLALPILSLSACGDKDAVQILDLRSELDVTLLNYQSVPFNVPDNIPLNQDLGASRTLTFSARTEPVQLSLSNRGVDFVEIKKAAFSFRMDMEPQNFQGTVEVRMYISPLFDVYSHNEAVRISKRDIVPTMFDFSGDDQRLNSYLQFDYFYIGFEFVIEPTLVSDNRIAISGRIEEFELTLTGSRSLSRSYY